MSQKLNYLYTPSQSNIDLPIKALCSDLPIEKLIWEDFEKLCLRIIQENHSIHNCEIYGTKGQKQHGIDIYVKKKIKYSSYQCKRYKSIKESDLTDAVELFKAGKWFDQSDEFVFCTTYALDSTQLQDRFNKLKDELQQDNITLIKWDKTKLCLLLKDHPRIVYDFFGREWVKAFNGEDYLNQILEKRRLDALQISIFRRKLFEIYSIIFQKYDPSIPSGQLNGDYAIPLQDRFIIPEFVKRHKEIKYTKDLERSDRSIEEVSNNDYQNEASYERYLNEKKNNERINSIQIEVEHRLDIDICLPDTTKNIMILGEPGSGKSSLFRYLILDLLSDSPTLNNIAKHWGNLLPIWLPFAFITKNMDLDHNISLVEILHIWFKSIDKVDTFELVKDALEDERLLLFIDGVDEWTNPSIAEYAISKIEIQVELINAKAIYSSRPYGYRLQQEFFQNLTIYTIASFSDIQRKEYISFWYIKWVESQNISDIDFVNKETNNFLLELKKSKDLQRLSENPLLLSILISQRFENAILPKNKVELLKHISEYLIKKHPSKRKISASIVDDLDLDFEMQDIISELAINIQENYHDGIISKSDAQNIIIEYLKAYAGYTAANAKKISKDILDIGANSIGIIVEKSPNEISFMHRQFQEFMAAKYLIENDSELVVQKLKLFANNPSWNQVIYFLFGLIPPRKKSEFEIYLSELKGLNPKELGYLDFLRYSIVLTLSNIPINVSKKYLVSFIELFEYEMDSNKKEIMWDILIHSLENSKIRFDLLNFFFKFFPNQIIYSDNRLNVLSNLTSSQLTCKIRQFLIKTLINGTEQQKIEASNIIQALIDDEILKNEILSLLEKCRNVEILGYLINTIISSHIDDNVKNRILSKHFESISSSVFLFVIKLKISLKINNINDLKMLVNVLEYVPYSLNDEVEEVLISGWGGTQQLLDYIIHGLNYGKMEEKIKSDIAWRILFKSYNNNADVIQKVADELTVQEYPFTHMHALESWQLLSECFEGNEKIIASAEKYIELNQEKYREPELVFACLIGKTKKNKQYLLSTLKTSGVSHWNCMALLKGWPNDLEVTDNLIEYFRSNNKNRDMAAGYIGEIFKNDIEEGVSIAEKILFDRNLNRRYRALSSLIELDKERFKKNTLQKIIDKELIFFDKNDEWSGYCFILEQLIDNFHDHDSVKKLINENLTKFPQLVHLKLPSKFEESVSASLPLAENFRLKFIEEIAQSNFLGDELNSLTNQLSSFWTEENFAVRIRSAITYFNFVKKSSPDTILEICNKLVFYRGFDYEIQRQIAFAGYLILKKLDLYFLLEDDNEALTDKDQTKRLAHPHLNIYDFYHKNSIEIVKLVINNFDYVLESIQNDLSKIVYYEKSTQQIWGWIAKHSLKDSPSTPHILQYIESHSKEIENIDLIEFLDRFSLNDALLKDLLINNIRNEDSELAIFCGKKFGEKFAYDNETYILNKKNISFTEDFGTIMAICYGWPQDPILKEIFDAFVQSESVVPRSLANTISIIFKDVLALLDALNDIIEKSGERRIMGHEYFLPPLLRRLKIDKDLQLAIKNELLNTTNISKTISFYSLLDSIGYIDDELRNWKLNQKSSEFSSSVGFNLVSNRACSLEEVLDVFHFEYTY